MLLLVLHIFFTSPLVFSSRERAQGLLEGIQDELSVFLEWTLEKGNQFCCHGLESVVQWYLFLFYGISVVLRHLMNRMSLWGN